ncbi:acyl-CoA Delta-9 desaturase-like isoform X2 [Ischnura elegans]|nr:acyl-CoA Delta-9 desaturase-like isoform X2 [Ischnura elegans]
MEEHDKENNNVQKTSSGESNNVHKTHPHRIIWGNVIGITFFHLLAVYALWILFWNFRIQTFIWGLALGVASGLGVTAGAHRLWAHRSYKARRPLQALLLLFYTMAGQNSVYEWVRDHRVHHKFSETDADPHNAQRGFFFAHVGWLMQRKHPSVIAKGKQVDMSDIVDDPLLAFHTKYFIPLKILFCFVIPVAVPSLFWNEPWFHSFVLIGCLRYIIALNITWCVNSAAHLWGFKPYDQSIFPSQNKLVSFLAMGEGWHNYHHVFPWDYKTSEFGESLNATRGFIDLCASIGLAYDLKTAPPRLVEQRARRTGDGSHASCTPHNKDDIHSS